MTNLLRLLKLSAKSLLLHPLRSGLTVLGILIGVASVVWLMAIGEGISLASQKQIASLGAKNIIVRTIKPTTDRFEGGGYGVTRDDYDRIAATVPTLDRTLPIRELEQEFRNGPRKLEGRLVGSTGDYAEMTRLRIDQGRFLTAIDLEKEINHCVLAAEVADHLFPAGDALGQRVMIDKDFYVVVGVAAPRAASAGIGGSLAAEDYAADIYIPITTFWRRLGDTIISIKPGQFERNIIEVSQLTLRVREQGDVLKTADLIRDTLAPHHRLKDFAITVPFELMQQARTTQLMFILVLGLIAAISLVVGGIGVMNIMLTTVTERTREIGVRRALGAKRRDITGQFLTESVFLAVVGGGLGVLVGLACRPLLVAVRTVLFQLFPLQMESLPELIREVEPVLVFWSIPLAFVISALVGVVFGVYPATRAAKLDPIVALRNE
ncbi:MAG: ABC transporter permease [Planctomycetota bacterium]